MPSCNSIVRAFASLGHDLGTVEDKILVPKPPKNCARCTRCGYLVDGPNCQGCALLRQELEENVVTYSLDFQNSSEPSDASTNDAHIGYNCPSKVSVISNPEPYNNQTTDELPQALPVFHPTFHSEAESPFTLDSTPAYVDESLNVFNPPSQPPVVENLVLNRSESEGEYECDVPACEVFTIFSNILFDADYGFYSSDDLSFSDEDIPKEIYLNPLFDEEFISMKIDPHHFNAESDLTESLLNHDSSIISSSLKIDSLFDKFAGELTLLKSIPPRINETDYNPKEEICFIKILFYDNSSPCHYQQFL
uniref:Uncharacterized protein n=1 Tax=Tanacetum cinerariifolium TaxID=118510 RepID=A0A6L2N762_TANCI|nr:hypothetical protein [Tanacetum cinerariifolium]